MFAGFRRSSGRPARWPSYTTSQRELRTAIHDSGQGASLCVKPSCISAGSREPAMCCADSCIHVQTSYVNRELEPCLCRAAGQQARLLAKSTHSSTKSSWQGKDRQRAGRGGRARTPWPCGRLGEAGDQEPRKELQEAQARLAELGPRHLRAQSTSSRKPAKCQQKKGQLFLFACSRRGMGSEVFDFGPKIVLSGACRPLTCHEREERKYASTAICCMLSQCQVAGISQTRVLCTMAPRPHHLWLAETSLK